MEIPAHERLSLERRGRPRMEDPNLRQHGPRSLKAAGRGTQHLEYLSPVRVGRRKRRMTGRSRFHLGVRSHHPQFHHGPNPAGNGRAQSKTGHPRTSRGAALSGRWRPVSSPPCSVWGCQRIALSRGPGHDPPPSRLGNTTLRHRTRRSAGNPE